MQLLSSYLGQKYSFGSMGGTEKGMRGRQRNCGQGPQSLVRLKHSSTLGLCISMEKGFNRTKQRAFNISKKLPCKAMLRVGTILVNMR